VKPQDIDYLRAELAQAQQMCLTSTSVRVGELQALLDKIRHLETLPEQPVKVVGFAREGEVEQIRLGKVMTIRVRRLPNEWCTQPIYFEQRQA